MPRGDQSGPMGMGPRTGRGLGYCTGSGEPGYMHPGPGYEYGWGMAWRRGRRGSYRRGGRGWGPMGYGYGPMPYDAPWPVAPVDTEAQMEREMMALKSQAGWLQEQLDLIQARMEELNRPTEDEGPID
jgi:hypothetical protein